MATHKHWRGSVANPSRKYIRVKFEADEIGIAIDPATDYTYAIALLTKSVPYDSDTLTWQAASYATSGGEHYLVSLLGTGQTIDPVANSDVYVKATSGTETETPVIFQALGDVVVV